MEFEVEVLLRDFYDVLKQEYYDDSEEHLDICSNSISIVI